MPKETGVPSLSSDRPTASPYASTAETAARTNMFKKLVRSVYNKESMEEAKCLICMEPPHNAVILNCSNLEKGCRPYMCGRSNRLSTVSTIFLNHLPRPQHLRAHFAEGKSTRNYLELENHASLEHPSVRPSVVDTVLMRDWRRELSGTREPCQLEHPSVRPSVADPVRMQIGGGCSAKGTGG
ncbi:hypothetical protein C3L33_18094, partial [Rhododendron williamsianum]